MRILAIDPGPTESAFVLLADDGVKDADKFTNKEIRDMLLRWPAPDTRLAIEMIACYGMAVGAEVFETCVNIGRFIECAFEWCPEPLLIKRHEVKMHLCHNPRANDSNIRQALIDLYGPGKEKAIGTTKARGPLYGIKGDEWAALAVAKVAQAKLEPVAVEI